MDDAGRSAALVLNSVARVQSISQSGVARIEAAVEETVGVKRGQNR